MKISFLTKTILLSMFYFTLITLAIACEDRMVFFTLCFMYLFTIGIIVFKNRKELMKKQKNIRNKKDTTENIIIKSPKNKKKKVCKKIISKNQECQTQNYSMTAQQLVQIIDEITDKKLTIVCAKLRERFIKIKLEMESINNSVDKLDKYIGWVEDDIEDIKLQISQTDLPEKIFDNVDDDECDDDLFIPKPLNYD